MLLKAAEFWVGGNFAESYLLGSLSAGVTSFALPSGHGALFPVLGSGGRRFPLVIRETEVVVCTLRSSDTFTVTRGQEGTSDVFHAAGSSVRLNLTAAMFNDLALRCSRNERILALVAGGGRDGVKSNDSDTYLKVAQQTVANMTVKVAAGFGFISGEPFELESETNTGTLVAPVTNPRIDLVQFTLGTGVNVKTGVEHASPTAPTVDAGAVELGRLAMTVGMTSVVTAGITDRRVMI